MKRFLTFALFAAMAVSALAVIPTKKLTVDIGRPDNTFVLGPVSRGATDYIDISLKVNGATYATNDLSGYIFYSESIASTSGVFIATVNSATINGHVYVQASTTDFLGFSTNATDYPTTNHCQVVLTNATQTFVWDHGQLIIRWDPATGGAGSATLANITPVQSILGLSDTPTTFSGNATKLLAVNATETATEFVTAGSGDITAVNMYNGTWMTGAVQTASGEHNQTPGVDTNAVMAAVTGKGYLPKTGTESMTGNLTMATNGLRQVLDIHFIPTNAAASHVVGDVYFDATDNTLAVRSDVADVTLQIGQEFWARAKKLAGTTITNGMVVYHSGASGDRPLVDRADAVTNQTVFGVATHTWSSNDGWITKFGLVRDLNTANWTLGDNLFVSANPGALTNVSQYAGQGKVGNVLRVHSSAGIIYVDMQPDDVDPNAVYVDGTRAMTSDLDIKGTNVMAEINAKLPLSGGTMQGNINMNAFSLFGGIVDAGQLTTGTLPTSAETDPVLVTVSNSFLRRSGGTMTGAIDFFGGGTVEASTEGVAILDNGGQRGINVANDIREIVDTNGVVVASWENGALDIDTDVKGGAPGTTNAVTPNGLVDIAALLGGGGGGAIETKSTTLTRINMVGTTGSPTTYNDVIFTNMTAGLWVFDAMIRFADTSSEPVRINASFVRVDNSDRGTISTTYADWAPSDTYRNLNRAQIALPSTAIQIDSTTNQVKMMWYIDDGSLTADGYIIAGAYRIGNAQ